LWTGEIDNAVFVAVAEEVVAYGPQGAGLGVGRKGFALLADAFRRVASGGQILDADTRLEAIYVVSLSAFLALTLAGFSIAVSMILLRDAWGAPRGALLVQHSSRTAFVKGTLSALLVTGLGVLFAAAAPVRAGFLTFAWGFVWTLLVYVTVLLGLSAGTTRALLGSSAVGIVGLVMALATHPTAVAAVVPLVFLSLVLSAWKIWQMTILKPRFPRFGTKRTAYASIALLTIALASLTPRMLRRASLPDLSIASLVADGSGIAVEASVKVALAGVVLCWCIVLVGQLREATRDEPPQISRHVLALVPVLPVVGYAATYMLVAWAGRSVIGAGDAYFSRKALYGLAAAVLVFVLPAALARRERFDLLKTALVVAVVATVWQGSAVSQFAQSWWYWSSRPVSPHAVSVVRAIESTVPGTLIRCRPGPEILADPTVREAAFFCVAWPETAFNGRAAQNAFRHDYRRLDDGQPLGVVVDRADAWGLYFLAYTYPMETGWFGWTGASSAQ
jgi:hypothetical protein